MIKHTEAFKHEAVRIALTNGLPRERGASDLGIGNSTLGKWLAQYRLSLGSYGRSRIAMELKEVGRNVAERRVRRLMKINGVKPVRTRKNKVGDRALSPA